MDSHTNGGSVMSRHRWWRRCLVTSTVAVMVAVGGSAAMAQPTETTPAAPTTPTTTQPAAPDSVPLQAPTETTTMDPCAVPTTTAPTTTPTVPSTTTTTEPVPPTCEPTVPATTTTPASEPATPPLATEASSTGNESSTPATTSAEASTAAPGKKEPWVKWTPTENPNSTIVPGKMRSDRQELPEGFTKEDADKAEILEAKILAASRSRTARSASATNVLAAAAPTDCITYFPAWQYQVCGEIRVKYDSLGNVNSFLLWPTSGNITNPDGVGQRVTFVNGPIYWHPNAGAHPVVNHFMMKWGELSWEAGYLGYPTTDEIVLQSSTDNIGRRQEFQGGHVYWHPTRSNLNAVRGAVLSKYLATGAQNGPLGYPKSDEIGLPDGVGRMSSFEFGNIYFTSQTGAWPVLGTSDPILGKIMGKWAATNYEQGPFGYPIGDEQPQVGTSGVKSMSLMA